jgi:hypothetical protein
MKYPDDDDAAYLMRELWAAAVRRGPMWLFVCHWEPEPYGLVHVKFVRSDGYSRTCAMDPKAYSVLIVNVPEALDEFFAGSPTWNTDSQSMNRGDDAK